VQLITSAGMRIERGPNPLKLKQGGDVYLSDDEASSGACIRNDDSTIDPNQVCRGNTGGPPSQATRRSGLFELCFTLGVYRYGEVQPMILKGYYNMHQLRGNVR